MATAGTAVADAGAANGSGQVSPPAAASSVAPAPERPLHYGKAQMVPPPPREEETPESAPEPEQGQAPVQDVDGQDEPLDLEGANPEGEGAADGAEQPVPDVAQWAATLREAPTRINEIPAKQRAEAIRQMLARERESYEQAAHLAYQRGAQEAQQAAQVASAVAEIDQLRSDDPEAFVRWEDQFPDRAAAYRAFKTRQAPPAGQRAEAVLISQQTAAIVTRLKAVPGAHEALLALGKQYPATVDGIAALTADAADVLADAKTRQKANDPDARKAAARQANAESLKGIPKPAGTGAAGSDAELTPERLLQMTQAEVAALYDKPGGAEQITKAMSQHAKKYA